MVDRKQQPQQYETSKIDALYSWLSYDLQRMKGELLSELKYSSVQMGSLYQEMRKDKESSAGAITQEIRYSYKQNQTIYDGLATMLKKEVGERLNSMDEKFTSIEQVRALNEELVALVSGNVSSKLETVSAMEALLVKIDAAIAALPETSVDYTRIAEEVGDKLLEVLSDAKEDQASTLDALKVDYEKIACGTAEKVVESLPYPEKVDYRRVAQIAETAAISAVEKVLAAFNTEALAVAVAEKVCVPEIDYDRLADMVAAKLAANSEQHFEVMLDDMGIDQIAEKVSTKLSVAESIDYDRVCQAAQAAQVVPESVDYDRISDIVEDKLAKEEDTTYDLVIDQEGIDAIAKGVAKELCNTCSVCEEKAEETVIEEEAQEDAPVVAEEEVAAQEEVVEEAVEETAEVATEEPVVEEPVEVAQEETTEEIVEETQTAEVVMQDTSASDELAAAFAADFDEVNNQLVDAETGLVIRLKKSFTAKMKQSEERVKGYYSDIKNELTSYKKINSNVSWHGDRFNYGRETIAKINICGKTLCFYVALDPNDPEYKTTVYHQKDVGNQKAYESTPFMVKVKSDAAAKKALRLVGYLAEKVGAEKDEAFVPVDYVEQFAYESTKQLFEEGYIKATKEKKVDLDF